MSIICKTACGTGKSRVRVSDGPPNGMVAQRQSNALSGRRLRVRISSIPPESLAPVGKGALQMPLLVGLYLSVRRLKTLYKCRTGATLGPPIPTLTGKAYNKCQLAAKPYATDPRYGSASFVSSANRALVFETRCRQFESDTKLHMQV